MKIRPSIVIIITLIFLVSILLLALTWREKQHINDLEKATELLEQKEKRHLENLNEFIQNYNELYASYNELYKSYQELASEKGFYEGWEKAICTAYTSLDDGCNSYSAVGINIEKWSEYFNFCAIDPDGEIDYGDIVLVRLNYRIVPFLAVDCGYAIKDEDGKKRLDLYFVNDLDNAFKFGVKELEIKVLK